MPQELRSGSGEPDTNRLIERFDRDEEFSIGAAEDPARPSRMDMVLFSPGSN
jgi:hypothetical protein